MKLPPLLPLTDRPAGGFAPDSTLGHLLNPPGSEVASHFSDLYVRVTNEPTVPACPQPAYEVVGFLPGSKRALKLRSPAGDLKVWKACDAVNGPSETGATRLASHITDGLVPVADRFSFCGQDGVIQPYVVPAEEKFDPRGLDARQSAQVFVHMIADRVVSNHDAHGGNFTVAAEGHDVVGFDKGQAFKFFRGGNIVSPYAGAVIEPHAIDPFFAAAPFFPDDKPAYAEFFRAVRKGAVPFDPADPAIEDALRRCENLTAEHVEDWLGEFAAAVYPGNEARFFDAVWTRARGIRAEAAPLLETLAKGPPDPKIRLAQMRVIPHDPEKNFKRILEILDEARADGDQIVVFPALCLTGSRLGDRLENERYLAEILRYNELIREASQNLVVIWGSVDADFNAKGHDGNAVKHEAVFVAKNGRWVENGVFAGKALKTVAVNYRGRADERHFEPVSATAARLGVKPEDLIRPFPIVIDGRVLRLGLTVDEDIWTEHSRLNPAKILYERGADLIVNVASSNWTWRKDRKRRDIGKMTAEAAPVPLIVVNDVGLQNEGNNFYAHDGRSLVFGADGGVRAELPAFSDATRVVRPSEISYQERLPTPVYGRERDVEQMWEALLFGSRSFAMPSLVLVSGGVDSAVVLALEAIAKGADSVLAATMPGPYTGETYGFVKRLMDNLGVWQAAAPIGATLDVLAEEMAELTFSSSRHPGGNRSFPIEKGGLSYGNLQARERGNRGMTLAQMSGHVLVNTATKPEIAFGFGAIHGNWIGIATPLGDVPKGRQFEDDPSERVGVWDLARYINKRYGNPIPREIIEQKPTTELSRQAEQPFFFPYHDAMVDAWLGFPIKGRDLRDPEAFLEAFADGTLDRDLGLPEGAILGFFGSADNFIADLEDKWGRFHTNNYKQSLMPPVLVLSRRALGNDKRHSQGPAPYARRYQELKERILKNSS